MSKNEELVSKLRKQATLYYECKDSSSKAFIKYNQVETEILTKLEAGDRAVEENKLLQKRLEVACHVKADDKVEFDWSVLDIIDRYERLEEVICAAAPLMWADGKYIDEVANFEKALTDILHDNPDFPRSMGCKEGK